MKAFLGLALAAVLVLATAPLLRGTEAPGEDWIELRVRQSGGDTVFAAPRALVDGMAASPTGFTTPIGTLKGRPVRLSVDRVLRAMREVPAAPERETHLFTRPTDSGPVSFYARPFRQASSGRGGTPHFLLFDLTPKGKGGSPTHLKLPLLGAATMGAALTGALGVQPDSDVQPLLESFLGCAQKMGAGRLARFSAPDAEIALATE